MNKHLFKEFSKHLCTCFFILFLPVIALNICYQYYFLKLYQTEIINQESNSLNKFQIYFDDEVNAVNQFANQLSLSTKISSLNIFYNSSAFYDIFKELNTLKSLDSSLMDIYYYNGLASPDTVYSCQGTYNISTYSALNPRFLDGYQSLGGKLGSITSPVFKPQAENVFSFSQPAVEYIVPVKNQPLYFVFRIKPSFFSEALNNVYAADYSPYTCILSDGSILYSQFPKDVSIDLRDFGKMPPSDLKTFRQGRYFISAVTSSGTGITYLSLIDKNLLMKKGHALSSKFLLLNVFILLLGFIIVFFQTHQYYKPIRRLLSSMNGFGLTLSANLNSFDQVAKGMNQLDESNRHLKYEKCLLKLLSGAWRSMDEFNQNAPVEGVILCYGHYRVMTICHLKTPQASEDERESLNGCWSIACDGIQLLTLERETDHMHIVLLFYRPDMEETLKEKITAFGNRLSQTISFSYRIYVSAGYRELSAMPRALSECYRLSDENHVWEDASPCFYEDAKGGMSEAFYYPETELSGLLEALEKQDTGNIQLYAQRLIDYMNQLEEHHLLFLPLTYTITHAFRKAAGAYNISALPVVPPQTVSFTKTALIRFMQSMASEITGIIDLRQKACQSLSSRTIIDYIEKHYCENQLSVSSLADHFGLSVSHLSHYFKETTGVKPSTYINSLRIERSKKLLCKTDMTVGEISAAIGYTQPSSFIRRFKQFTGTTPGEYRVHEKSAAR